MPINFHPKAGTVLLCDFHDTVWPEMRKRRPVIVVSKYQLNKRGLCTVVPLSTKTPNPVERQHVQLLEGSYNFVHPHKPTWVKCDMIYRVSFKRLDRLKVNKRYVAPKLKDEDLKEIMAATTSALYGFS